MNTAPHKASAKRLAESRAFDFLIADNRPMLKTTEVAAYFGRGGTHVINLIEEGRLEAHALPDRQKKRYTITRRSALLHLAETAEYAPDEFPKRLEALLAFLSREQLQAHAATVARLLAKF